MQTSILVSSCCFGFGLTPVITPECEMMFQCSRMYTSIKSYSGIPRNTPVKLFFQALRPTVFHLGQVKEPFQTNNCIDFVENSTLGAHNRSKGSLSSDYLLHAVFFQLTKPIPSFSKQTLILEQNGQVVPVKGFCFRH